MPWPWEMGHHIIDPLTFRPHFWPWPNENWSFNKFALDAMQIVYSMKNLMEKQPEMWTPQDDNFYKAVVEEAEDYISYVSNSISLQSSNNNQ